jgi:hypothetical protein
MEYVLTPREPCEAGGGFSGVDASRLRGVTGDMTLFPSGRMDTLELVPPVVSAEGGGTTGSRLLLRSA